jgi:hypothetical protein
MSLKNKQRTDLGQYLYDLLGSGLDHLPDFVKHIGKIIASFVTRFNPDIYFKGDGGETEKYLLLSRPAGKAFRSKIAISLE